MEAVDRPTAKVGPGLVSPWEGNRDLGQANDAGSYPFGAVCGQEAPRGPGPAAPMLPHQVDEESRVGYHFRPPERRPRSFSIRFSTSKSTLGGGACS